MFLTVAAGTARCWSVVATGLLHSSQLVGLVLHSERYAMSSVIDIAVAIIESCFD